MLTVNKRDFISDWTPDATSTPMSLLKTDVIFSTVWPTAHMYLVKTIPKHASFQKCSPGLKSLKTPAFCLRVDGRKRRFSNTMMSYIINTS